MSEVITNVQNVSIGNAMQKHFIDYAMSVITERALPDVCDGLKPVQRRILYGANELGLTADKPYKKSARIVGDVLGKYHPHGDSSVYEAMVRMAQDFSMRYELIDGSGNFGSIDGDGAAAMRYTEARLSRYGQAMMADLHKNAVDFVPNFDGEEVEPKVLSGLIPNMLLNGSSGIAVGMATNLAPHNVNDVYNALYYIIDCTLNQEVINEDVLIDKIQAPDFPTGGVIVNVDSVRNAYKTGDGKVTLRADIEVDEDGKIIISEIPYKVNKAKLVERMDSLSRVTKEKGKPDKPAIIPEIKEVRDESDKTGIRIVVELKKDSNPQLALNKLLKHTDLQCNFSINNTVIVNGEPKKLSLYEMLNSFLAHSANVILRRTQYDYDKAEKRLHIVDGIIRCLENIDIVISLIKSSKTNKEAVEALMLNLGLTEAQADSAVQMRLIALTNASTEKFYNEKSEIEANMAKWYSILTDNNVLLETMKIEFEELRVKFSDERRTKIVNDSATINEEDLVKDETLVVTITDTGLIKSVSDAEYNTQKRGGKGTKAASTKEDEIIKYMFTTNSKDNIMFFTNLGRVHLLKAYKIPKSNKSAKGKSIFNFLSLDTERGETIVNVIAANINDTSRSLLLATRNGIIKRLPLDKLSSRLSVTKIITFREGDSLQAVQLVSEGDKVIMNTAQGLSLTTIVTETSIRPMGREASGVTGMKFKLENDYLVDMSVCDKQYVFTLTESGLGKKTDIEEFTVQNRGGKGIVSHKLTERTGAVVAASTVSDEDDIFIVTEQGLMIRVKAKDISVTGRSASGVKLLTLNEGDAIVGISVSTYNNNEEEVAQE